MQYRLGPKWLRIIHPLTYMKNCNSSYLQNTLWLQPRIATNVYHHCKHTPPPTTASPVTHSPPPSSSPSSVRSLCPISSFQISDCRNVSVFDITETLTNWNTNDLLANCTPRNQLWIVVLINFRMARLQFDRI